jgi:glycosyltransferase involved in cell wall biosynthesis
MNELVSIVIPCYNQGIYLDEAVDSALAQTHPDVEIIIVNDGSTDSFTNELLANYKRPKTKVIITKNNGLAEARNVAIRNAKGKYILPLDADDIIAPEYCEKALRVIESDPKIGIVHGETQNFGANTNMRKDPPYSLEAMLRRNIILCSSLYRRDDWEKVGGYNKNMKYGGEDWDFWLSIIELGRDVYKIPETMFYYRIRPGSMARSIDEEKFRELRKQVYLNHLELYLNNFPDPISLYWEKYRTETKYNKIEHRLANKIISPLRRLLSK